MTRRFVFSLRIVVTLVFLMVSLGAFVMGRNGVYGSMRRELMALSRTGAAFVDPEFAKALADPAHGAARQPEAIRLLDRIISGTPSIRYAYLLAPTENPATFRFLADTDREAPAGFLEEFNAAQYPDLVGAVSEPRADQTITSDKWGYWISGYSPIKDAAGNTVAVLGIDLPSGRVYQQLVFVAAGSTMIGVLAAIALAMLARSMLARFTQSVHDLTVQVRSLSERVGEPPTAQSAAAQGEEAELLRYYERLVDRLEASRAEQSALFDQTLGALAAAINTRDAYTGDHSQGVAALTEAIADRLGIDGQERVCLRYGATLHDIGKIGVPDRILLKAGPLTPEERAEIEEHPRIGYDLLYRVAALRPVAEIVLAHHERWDGMGYPRGLYGEAIPVAARIIAVVDAFSAMTTDRSYRKARPVDWALEELARNAGTQFDPAVVTALIESVEAQSFRWLNSSAG